MSSNSLDVKSVKPDYGLDAPSVVRNLIIGFVVGMLLWISILTGLWSGIVRLGPVAISVKPMGLVGGGICGAMAWWMVWSSKVGKLKERDHALNLLTWNGVESVLDVGCGRGLMLIGAAKRLPTGKASGIDIWQSEDLAGNSREATLNNARLEGVLERIEIQTADMRQMPFGDATFDRIVSCNAIHNIYDAAERDKSLREIARVLKPGGSALIIDIRHMRQYERVLREHGCDEIRMMGSPLTALLLGILTWGALRPGTLLARKAAQ